MAARIFSQAILIVQLLVIKEASSVNKTAATTTNATIMRVKARVMYVCPFSAKIDWIADPAGDNYTINVYPTVNRSGKLMRKRGADITLNTTRLRIQVKGLQPLTTYTVQVVPGKDAAKGSNRIIFTTPERTLGVAAIAYQYREDLCKADVPTMEIKLTPTRLDGSRVWVTACPGLKKLEFRVKGSPAYIYLSTQFQPFDDTSEPKWSYVTNGVQSNWVKIAIDDGGSGTTKVASISYNGHCLPGDKEPDNRNCFFRILDKGTFLSNNSYTSFWIWWEPHGRVVVGQIKPGRKDSNKTKPDIAQDSTTVLLSFMLNDFHDNSWIIRSIGFGTWYKSDYKYPEINPPMSWIVNMEYPIHDENHTHDDEIQKQQRYEGFYDLANTF